MAGMLRLTFQVGQPWRLRSRLSEIPKFMQVCAIGDESALFCRCILHLSFVQAWGTDLTSSNMD
jgi:hypothetical protein